MYVRCFWQGNHHIYGVYIRFWPTLNICVLQTLKVMYESTLHSCASTCICVLFRPRFGQQLVFIARTAFLRFRLHPRSSPATLWTAFFFARTAFLRFHLHPRSSPATLWTAACIFCKERVPGVLWDPLAASRTCFVSFLYFLSVWHTDPTKQIDAKLNAKSMPKRCQIDAINVISMQACLHQSVPRAQPPICAKTSTTSYLCQNEHSLHSLPK